MVSFSPDPLHYEHCMAALEKGKHVLCTKPMMVSIEQSRKIVDLVNEKKAKFMVGQTMRYEPQFAALHTMFEDGDLGNVFYGRSSLHS